MLQEKFKKKKNFNGKSEWILIEKMKKKKGQFYKEKACIHAVKVLFGTKITIKNFEYFS